MKKLGQAQSFLTYLRIIMARRRWRGLVVALSVGALWILLAWGTARLLIVRAPLQQTDAIVVLSGSATYRERTEWATKLYKEARAPRVILTNDNQQGGWSSAEQRNLFFYERAFKNLVSLGVPEQHIEVLPQTVSSTAEEAALLRSYAAQHRLSSILVVTSAYHSRRAFWTFRRLFQNTGISVGIEPVEVGIQTPPPLTWWLHLGGWKTIPGEYAKIIYYQLRLLKKPILSTWIGTFAILFAANRFPGIWGDLRGE